MLQVHQCVAAVEVGFDAAAEERCRKVFDRPANATCAHTATEFTSVSRCLPVNGIRSRRSMIFCFLFVHLLPTTGLHIATLSYDYYPSYHSSHIRFRRKRRELFAPIFVIWREYTLFGHMDCDTRGMIETSTWCTFEVN